MCGLQIRLCLFTFRSIALKQLNSLTTNDTFSWLVGPEVTSGMLEVPGSIPAHGKDFNVWFSILLLCFYFFVQNALFVLDVCNSFL